ncbi:response regulator [Bradyrhizobium sp. WBOS7]|uniref:Response regulator n=1 Tax=Bradyrhizobium betae TaxID=244734 RepID=A0AAE9N6V4_9BRAD|nr:response regulator [Bradyrhizobium sp. WBOS2]MDD1574267.1 response regulator [Bradyrhizobium sp. WBOS1]MDD1579233.1 response regulator [Bradyrhizobium sp. WBOS7]MDD1603567.1 response regulator [Bradyrhizobium sp. WBOS16]UUO33681.1 response regulator [Bradyrhizobium sp. WBOS01]UUO40109.1 response regulator [Bradyrhizobium sp. WBOS02]UUO52217.1 response regulator [Bradyrhizobium sp. WBOS07]UUO64384.1 response regulator [Bradyrhizobium betae]
MPPSVLIVEDEIFVASDIARILEDAGYRVAGIATDRKEALEAGPQAQIALVDVNLRDGSTGPQIALDLARNYGTKIVYVTANPAQIEPRAGTAIGFIRKPFSDEAILTAVQHAAGVPEALRSPDVTFFAAAGGSSTSSES